MARCAARLWPLQDAVQLVRALDTQRRLGSRIRAAVRRRAAARAAAGLDPGQGASSGGGGKGGRPTRRSGARGAAARPNSHAAVDEAGRPRRLIVRPDHRGDAPVAPALVAALTPQRCLADTAYDRAALRATGLTAPLVLDGPLTTEAFRAYVAQLLGPTLRPGDLVILDNLSVHKDPVSAQLIAQQGATLLFLPPYSHNLNPIEQVFAKLKALARGAALRSREALWTSLGVAPHPDLTGGMSPVLPPLWLHRNVNRSSCRQTVSSQPEPCGDKGPGRDSWNNREICVQR